MVVGSLNVDLVVRVEALPKPGETVRGTDLRRSAGGKGLNQAVAAARFGVPVALVGCVGDDDDGRLLRAVVAEEGIDGEGVLDAPRPTGTASVTVGPDGANTIVVSPGANAATDGASVAGAAHDRADVVLAQAEVPDAAVLAAFSAARAAGARTVLNQAPFRPLAPALWALVDVLIVNQTELVELLRSEGEGGLADRCDRFPAEAPAGARALLDRHPAVGWIVVTVGAGGAFGVPGDGEVVVQVPPPVDAVDTVGAGDCLAGWVAGGLAVGWSLDDALAPRCGPRRWRSSGRAPSPPCPPSPR